MRNLYLLQPASTPGISQKNPIFLYIWRYLIHQALLGIGETGIDRRCSTPVEIQKSLFRDHITLSEKLKKPLIIHCVKSASDIVSLFKQSNIQQNWLIHGFNGRTGAFDLLASQGFHFSFGAALMLSDSNSSKHIKQLPLSRVFLETDDSDISIEEVYRAASEILMLDISRLRGIIMDNFCRFFGVKDVSQLAGKNGTTG